VAVETSRLKACLEIRGPLIAHFGSPPLSAKFV
jgi:hypothetical protein